MTVAEVQNGERLQSAACFDLFYCSMEAFKPLRCGHRTAIAGTNGRNKKNGENDLRG